jgi:hypothetical protein
VSVALRESPFAHDGVLVEPASGGNGTGVLVLSGSSGRVERERARLLASAGVTAALTYRWFGGDGQPAGIWEYPLESFAPAVASLAERCDRVWPSVQFARAVEARRRALDLPTTVVTHDGAGHRVLLPGEAVATGGQRMARGGTEAADRALGERAWPHLRRVLDLP